MKRILISVLLMIPVFSFAQIETSSVRVAPQAKETTPKEPYDSTKNMPSSSKYETYIGQMIYKDGKYYIVYKIERSQSKYSSYNTCTFYCKGRDDVLDSFQTDVFLSGNINPWLTVSYYNYLRTLIGQRFYLLEKDFRDNYTNYCYCLSSTDMNTGKVIDYQPFDLWEFTDIATKEDDGSFIAIFKNAKNEVAYCDLYQFGKTKDDSYKLLPQKEYDRLSKKYGSYYTKMMLKHDYEVGMPKELFRLLWGKPSSINSSTYSEQWVYGSGLDNDYFYFSNGKLTGWN